MSVIENETDGENRRKRDNTFKGEFTHRWVSATKPQAKEVQYAQRLKKGRSLMLYVSPLGTKTWRALYYDKGRPRSERLGTFPDLRVAEALELALNFNAKQAAAATKAGTFRKVAEDWFVDHVEKYNLTSKAEIRRQLETYVYPTLGDRRIFKIERSDINDLLRKIENKQISYDWSKKKKKNKKKKFIGGKSQADAVLATIRSIMTWYAADTNNYVSPIVPKMKRDKRTAAEKARTRTLDHDEIIEEGEIRMEFNDRGEIRGLWAACEEMGQYGSLIKLLLLTGQRRDKVASMKWTDISDGVWTIRSGKNRKGTAGKIKLTQPALDILDSLPRIVGNDYVFAVANGRHFNSFSQRKDELDELLPPEMPEWRLHDLRRTATSLMARAGVLEDIAERTIGHKVQGMRRVYNRHDYTAEKNAALEKLADQIALILNPPDTSNVVRLR